MAIFFTDFSLNKNSHDVSFDAIEELGLNIGKLVRISFAFYQRDNNLYDIDFNRDEITDEW